MTAINASPPRIAVVSVYYYARYLERSLRALRAICAELRPYMCVLVSNNPALMPRLQETTCHSPCMKGVRLHDNTGLEFGAYQAGIDFVLARGEPDWIVVLNDTFAIHQCFSTPMRRNFTGHVAAPRDLEIPIIVGQVESIPRSYRLQGLRTHRWVTTNAFALNRSALSLLQYKVYSPGLDDLITPSGRIESFFSGELDSVLRQHLSSWLFTLNGSWAWYDAAPLNEGNATKHANKARSILQEKYIGAQLDAVSADFVNIKDMSRRDKLQRRLEEHMFALRNRVRTSVFV